MGVVAGPISEGSVMTKPINGTHNGMPYWRVRVGLPGFVLHPASSIEPKVLRGATGVTDVQADWIEDPTCGDTLGFIDWAVVTSITWRLSGVEVAP
jgi:hypothetical protein